MEKAFGSQCFVFDKMNNHSKESSSSRFAQLPLIKQLAHVGAEIHRAHNWEEKKDTASRNNALERAIDLMDAVLEGSLSHRTKEIARLKEIICGCYAGQSESNVSLSLLDNYFLTLAIYTRNQKSHA